MGGGDIGAKETARTGLSDVSLITMLLSESLIFQT